MSFISTHKSSILIHCTLIHPFRDELINLMSEWVVTAVLLRGKGTRRIELERMLKCMPGSPRPAALLGTILHFHSSGKNTITALHQGTNDGANGLQCYCVCEQVDGEGLSCSRKLQWARLLTCSYFVAFWVSLNNRRFRRAFSCRTCWSSLSCQHTNNTQQY